MDNTRPSHFLLLTIFFIFYFSFLNKSEGDNCKNTENGFQEVTDEFNCQAIPIGDSVVIVDEEKISMSAPELPQRKFILSRKNAKTFQAIINFRFVEDSAVRQLQDLVSDTETSKENKMRERVKCCLNQVNPYLKGPNNQKLEIILADRKSKNPNFNKIETAITVGEGKNFQVHSLAYSQDMSCKTIIHEILHRLGLVDEYVETRSNLADGTKLNARNCRSHSNDSSIMSVVDSLNEEHFMNRAKQMTVSGEVCTCEDIYNCPRQSESSNCDEPGYKKEFRKINVADNIDPQMQSNLLAANPGLGMMSSSPQIPSKVLNMKTVRYDSVPRDSILLPAHFRYITKPLCKKENIKYTTCAERSNKGSSNGFLGLGKRNCETPPPYCRDGEWLN